MSSPEHAASVDAPVVGETPVFREAEIDLDALERNLAVLAGRLGVVPDGLSVDIGADAWGHGAALVAPALAGLGVRRLVVTRDAEAAVVRGAVPDAAPIVLQPTGGPMRLAAELDGPVLGAELFGLSETVDARPDAELSPVMHLWAPVTAVKRAHAGAGVSYGYTHRTTGETSLVLVPLGYADGLDRHASNGGAAQLEGDPARRIHRIAGRVAMDAFMLDLGDVAFPEIGTPVTVLGDARRGEPTAFDWAASIPNASSAEVVTRLSTRPRRTLVRRGPLLDAAAAAAAMPAGGVR